MVFFVVVRIMYAAAVPYPCKATRIFRTSIPSILNIISERERERERERDHEQKGDNASTIRSKRVTRVIVKTFIPPPPPPPPSF